MQVNGQGLVKINSLDRTLFMLLLQQKALTLNLILRWLAPESVRLPHGKRPNLYFRLNRLLKAGYLKKQRIEEQDLYLLAQPGMDEIRDINTRNLTAVTVAELDTVRHDLLAAEIRLYLESYGATGWVSDRELKPHTEKLPYVPDGACIVENKTVFVEIELSQKSKARYEQIAEAYTAEKGPDRVLYVYQDDEIIRYLEDLVAGHKRLGFFQYDAALGSPAAVTGRCDKEQVTLDCFLELP